MRPEHLAEIVAIENDCFAREAWTAQQLADEINLPYAHYVAAVVEGRVAGYADLHLVADDAHLNNIAVAREFRRRGIGSLLLRECLEWARRGNAAFVMLEVRAGNSAAFSLYRSCGFAPCSLRKNYYADPAEDAVNMRLELD